MIDALSYVATFLGMLASFAVCCVLGILYLVLRHREHSVILECLFLALLAMFIRQAIAVSIDAGQFGPGDSLAREGIRHGLTVLFACVSTWILYRMTSWLKQREPLIAGAD